MRILRTIIALWVFSLVGNLFANQTNYTIATLSITNSFTTNGQNFRLFFGADTNGYNYVWTNASPTGFHFIGATNSAEQSATNLYRKLTNDWNNRLLIKYLTSTGVVFQTYVGGSLFVTNSIGWGILTLATNSIDSNNIAGTFMVSNLYALHISGPAAGQIGTNGQYVHTFSQQFKTNIDLLTSIPSGAIFTNLDLRGTTTNDVIVANYLNGDGSGVSNIAATALPLNLKILNTNDARNLTNLNATNLVGYINGARLGTNSPSSGQVLSSTGAGGLKWIDASGGSATNFNTNQFNLTNGPIVSINVDAPITNPSLYRFVLKDTADGNGNDFNNLDQLEATNRVITRNILGETGSTLFVTATNSAESQGPDIVVQAGNVVHTFGTNADITPAGNLTLNAGSIPSGVGNALAGSVNINAGSCNGGTAGNINLHPGTTDGHGVGTNLIGWTFEGIKTYNDFTGTNTFHDYSIFLTNNDFTGTNTFYNYSIFSNNVFTSKTNSAAYFSGDGSLLSNVTSTATATNAIGNLNGTGTNTTIVNNDSAYTPLTINWIAGDVDPLTVFSFPLQLWESNGMALASIDVAGVFHGNGGGLTNLNISTNIHDRTAGGSGAIGTNLLLKVTTTSQDALTIDVRPTAGGTGPNAIVITNKDGVRVNLVDENVNVTGNLFTGDGSGLTNQNADNISSGTLSDARLSTNVLMVTNLFSQAPHDGATPANTVLQAELDGLHGGTLNFFPGIYLMTNTVTITNAGVHLVGSGSAATNGTIFRGTNINADIFYARLNTDPVNYPLMEDSVFENLAIESATRMTSGYAIHQRLCHRPLISKVRIGRTSPNNADPQNIYNGVFRDMCDEGKIFACNINVTNIGDRVLGYNDGVGGGLPGTGWSFFATYDEWIGGSTHIWGHPYATNSVGIVVDDNTGGVQVDACNVSFFNHALKTTNAVREIFVNNCFFDDVSGDALCIDSAVNTVDVRDSWQSGAQAGIHVTTNGSVVNNLHVSGTQIYSNTKGIVLDGQVGNFVFSGNTLFANGSGTNDLYLNIIPTNGTIASEGNVIATNGFGSIVMLPNSRNPGNTNVTFAEPVKTNNAITLLYFNNHNGSGSIQTNIFYRTSSVTLNTITNQDPVWFTILNATNEYMVGFLRITTLSVTNGVTNRGDILVHVDGLPYSTKNPVICQFQGAEDDDCQLLMVASVDGSGACKMQIGKNTGTSTTNNTIIIEAFGTNMPALSVTETNGQGVGELTYASSQFTSQNGLIAAGSLGATTYMVTGDGSSSTVIQLAGGTITFTGDILNLSGAAIVGSVSAAGGISADGGFSTVTGYACLATNTLPINATGITNTLAVDVQAVFTAGANLVWKETNDNTILSIGTISSPFSIRLHPNQAVTATAAAVGIAQP